MYSFEVGDKVEFEDYGNGIGEVVAVRERNHYHVRILRAGYGEAWHGKVVPMHVNYNRLRPAKEERS